MDTLSFLLENPLIVAGILGIITLLVYLSAENKYMRHKTKEIKKSVMRGWGIFLILIALISLFTTSWHVVLENVNVVSATPTGYVTLEQANRLCVNNEFERCDIISYGYIGSFTAIVVGIVLIIIGSIRARQKIKKDR